jgi:molecular chaperone DnaJ
MKKKDYYETLGLSPQASTEEIKKAYRQKALQFHPDRNPGSKESEDNFKEAAEAYSVLGDAEKREIYDRYGHAGLRGEGYSGFSGFDSTVFGDFEDILGNFFGFSFGDFFGGSTQSRRRGGQRGRDMALEMEVTLEEAARGVEKEVNLNRSDPCPDCHGSRLKPGAKKTVCPACQGHGQTRYQQGFFTIARACSECQGSGEVITSPCTECRGTGHVRGKKNLKVKIPAGIEDQSRLRVSGEGEAGDENSGRGDLYVVIRVKPHEFFERENNDLFCQVTISLAQAGLGMSIGIPTLFDQEVLKVPAGTQSGEVFRLKGQGLRDLRTQKMGDLYVKILVKTPDHLSKDDKDLLRQLAKSRHEEVEGVVKVTPHRLNRTVN